MGMNINFFFFFIIVVLLSILSIFKPTQKNIDIQESVALLEIESFKLYEFDNFGLRSITNGTHAKKYSDFYEIENVHFIRDKDNKIENIYAQYGRYDPDELSLNSNVKYVRADGLSFDSDEAKYLVLKELITTNGKFHINQNGNDIDGVALSYNVKNREISAKNIRGNFTIKE